MGRRPKPPAAEKRALLHATHPPRDQLLDAAEFYLQDGHLHDALDFFEKADEREGLERVRDAGVAAGDVGLLEWIERNALAPLSAEHWNAVARAAMNAGKLSFAARAFAKIADRDGLLQVKDAAVRQGDVILLERLAKGGDIAPARDDWLSAAQNARNNRQHLLAARAYEQAGDSPRAEEERQLGRGATRPAGGGGQC